MNAERKSTCVAFLCVSVRGRGAKVLFISYGRTLLCLSTIYVCFDFCTKMDDESMQIATTPCIRMRIAITGFNVLRQWMAFRSFEICNSSSSHQHIAVSLHHIHTRQLQIVNNLYGYCTIFSWNKSNNKNSCCIRFAIKSVCTWTPNAFWVCLQRIAKA